MHRLRNNKIIVLDEVSSINKIGEYNINQLIKQSISAPFPP